MEKLAKSPERNTFQKENYLKRQAEMGKTPENDDDTQAMFEYYQSWTTQKEEKEADPEWRENNMEYDLRSTQWILDKVRADDAYAQNLYAAMCNNEFQKNEFLPLLKGQTWSCSWRYAGGIIADMREQGDYIDWYCSGIRDTGFDTDDEDREEKPTPEQRRWQEILKRYVGESVVTDEIRADLKRLGWTVIEDSGEI